MSSDPLARALDAAIGGRVDALHALLSRGSHLPGTRMNDALSDAFAELCRSHRGGADAVALDLARLSADQAPGATAREFLPVCGIAALGARAAAVEDVRAAYVAELHSHADDLRFRMRDAVVDALARIGAQAGDALVVDVAPWMDGYFHAAAVVRALSADAWLGAVRDASAVVSRLDEAFALVTSAPRAAARWPGYKALVAALGSSSGLIAAALGVPVFDLLVRWSSNGDPVLREAISSALSLRKVVARFSSEVDRVAKALDASRPPRRNPDHDVGSTRDRSRRKSTRF